jgi:hypothetical protein
MKKKCTPILLVTAFLAASSVNAQVTLLGTNSPAIGSPFVGWGSGVLRPLEIRNNLTNQPINFFAGGPALQRMTILGTNGFVGIGATAPNQKLTVQNGNINLFTANQAYMINSRPVLWHNNITSSIFVGDGTGNTGTDNTFVGSLAGAANVAGTTAQDNTFVGARAGQNCAFGIGNVSIGNENGAKLSGILSRFNTYVGAGNASNASNSFRNVVVGHNAMQFASNAASNTIVGERAYFNPTTIGVGNVIMGSEACSITNSTVGDNNIVIGNRVNILGGVTAPLNDDNILIGAEAGASLSPPFVTVLNNAVAIGANAEVQSSNKMILGNNLMNVGIGLSGDNVFYGPRNRLEINTGSQTSNPSLAASGLMFRDLTSASPTTVANPGPGVLGVDVNGNVIYVPAGTSGTTIGNPCSAVVKNPLAASWEVPLANSNYIFSETAAGTGKVGIGNITTVCTPGNVLEVAKNGSTPNATGLSGLRLTDLKTGAGVATANGTVLSVNANGDVILVPDQQGAFPGAQNGLSNTVTAINPTGKVQLGQDIGEAGDPGLLLNDREIPFFSKTIYMDNFARIVMNRPVAGPKEATLEIGQHMNLGVYPFIPNFGAVSMGVKVDMPNNAGNPNVGIYSVSNSIAGNTGVYGEGGDLSNNTCYGVIGAAYAGANNTANGAGDAAYFPTIGVQGIARGFFDGTRYSRNLGGYFVANTTANYNYGVWATAPSSAGGSLNNWAGYFDGDVKFLGDGYVGGSLLFTSDILFKTNVDTITDPLNILKQLKPRTYFYDTTNVYGLTFSGKKQYGFVAQDINTVLPELVNTINKAADIDVAGNVIHPAVSYKTVNYNALFALLTSAMQKQQDIIDSLQHGTHVKDSLVDARMDQQDALIQQLMNMINACCQNPENRNAANGAGSIVQMNVELSDKDVIVLNQNVPNPFAEQTTITYHIPEKAGFAQIIFNDMKGQIIKVVDVKTKGKGQLNVFANDLSSGLYTYSLYVDGKLIDTKKMVKSE